MALTPWQPSQELEINGFGWPAPNYTVCVCVASQNAFASSRRVAGKCISHACDVFIVKFVLSSLVSVWIEHTLIPLVLVWFQVRQSRLKTRWSSDVGQEPCWFFAMKFGQTSGVLRLLLGVLSLLAASSKEGCRNDMDSARRDVWRPRRGPRRRLR